MNTRRFPRCRRPRRPRGLPCGDATKPALQCSLPPAYKTPHIAISQRTLPASSSSRPSPSPTSHPRSRASMAHNDQASGSHGGGYSRPTNLNSEKEQILVDKKILVSPAWHLPHGWNVSADGYAIAPTPPEGPLLDDYIEQRWEALPPVQRDLPEWHRRASSGCPSRRASGSGSSSSPATLDPTTTGTMWPTVGHTGTHATSTPCSGSTATASSAVRWHRHTTGVALRRCHYRGRRLGAIPQTADDG
jgi:hypothetical protein